jgi:hypothetical protein
MTALIFYMSNSRSFKPAAAGNRLRSHRRSKPERIADESETSSFSGFVRYNILYLNGILTITGNGRHRFADLLSSKPAKSGSVMVADNAGVIFRELSREQKSRMRVTSPVEMRMRQDKHHAWHDTSYYPYSIIDRRLAELGL